MNKLLALALILLSGCTAPIEVTTKPITKAPLVLPQVDEYTPQEVRFIVVTKSNIAAIMNEHQVLFALTTKNYEALAINTAAIKTLIIQLIAIQKALMLYYQ